MTKSRWFYDHEGLVGGPVSVAELRQLAAGGQLLPTDKVRKDDMERWVKARAVKGLFPPPDEATEAPPESRDGDTVFDFFGAGPPATGPQPAEEPPNPAFDFFGTAAYPTSSPPAEAE